jgi:hypothetical protein
MVDSSNPVASSDCAERVPLLPFSESRGLLDRE